MMRNRQLRRDLWLYLGTAAALTGLSCLVSPTYAPAVLGACILCAGLHFLVEFDRYRKLRRLSEELEMLLDQGTPLAIREYNEGELSILANQIQKMTLRLMESKEALGKEKVQLADSLADISHQLRTPLTAINLTAAMLSSPELEPGRRMELTRELRGLLTRTEWLVEALLKLSRLDAGMVKLARERVTVSTLIARAAAPLAIPMELRGQQLRVSDQDAVFTGDVAWTAEALGNVLKNAVEHTPEGGQITITAQENALFTQICIQDTGPGFAPEDIPRLFDRFYKGANASSQSYGIGLALARRIITAQDGTIQASNANPGARFTIKFYKQIM